MAEPRRSLAKRSSIRSASTRLKASADDFDREPRVFARYLILIAGDVTGGVAVNMWVKVGPKTYGRKNWSEYAIHIRGYQEWMGVDFSNHRPETLYSTGGYSTTSSE